MAGVFLHPYMLGSNWIISSAVKNNNMIYIHHLVHPQKLAWQRKKQQFEDILYLHIPLKNGGFPAIAMLISLL